MLNKKELIDLISVTRQHIDLLEVVIEKDYYVTQVIHALSNLDNEYFRLVFCGGTCLAKAHKIVNRMSEDVDFKIQIKNTDVAFSKTRLMKELKEFRLQIQSKITIPGLIANPPIVRNEGRYISIELNYPSAFPSGKGLRPHILLEFTLSNIRLSIENLPVKTLIEGTLKNVVIFEPATASCVSVSETAIEKWVGLTRRIVAIERGYHPDDDTLIRHVYDLNAIQNANRINDDFFMLAKNIISNDANQFKNQHPEYANNPGAEIQQSLEILKSKPLWKTRYDDFLDVMVYEKTGARNYDAALVALENLSKKIIYSIEHEKYKTQN